MCCKSKLNAVSTSQLKSKQTWFLWCLMPFGTIQHLNTQSTVLTNSSVLVASVVDGGMKIITSTKVIEFSLYPLYVCQCH